ncbi:MAG: serine/threonine-protein kinase [Pseudomonadota bacterium]
MTDPNWNRLWELFEQAVDLPADEQAAFLDRSCGEDAELRRRLVQLIARDAQREGMLDVGLEGSGLIDEVSSPLPGQVGAYRIIRELGRGGMGQVFLGERDDPEFRQQVAIKLIPLGRYSDAVLKRFVLERQILSDLNHENIARLLDGGVTDEGIPYLIMEYVDGQTIDAYCEDQNLDLQARLGLFQQVCRAVDYAHRRLIVHRDIKPGNVLVDQTGRVKLLDFGVAKLLEPALQGEDAVTETMGRMATPEYASPEQLKGERLSTATDVYSLGVLLYQLLTGKRPIEVTRSDLASTIQAVSAEEPARPSQLRAHGAPSVPSKLLRGDLDNIVMLALRKDPDRRYGSAAEFSTDVQRYLDGFPIQARPESMGYRAGKFIRRNRLAVAASTVVSFALIILAATSYLQARNLSAALAQANLERQKANEVVTFMRDLFKASDPLAPDANQRSTEQLLADGAERIRSELQGQPALQASLMSTMAEVYLNLSHFDEAQTLAEDALDVYRNNPTTGANSALKTQLTLARIAFLEEDFEQAMVLCEAALETAGSVDDQLEIRVQANLQCASAESFLGRYEASIDRVRNLLDGDLQLMAEQTDSVAEAHTVLGSNYWYLADYDRSRTEYGTAYELVLSRYGEQHPKSISALNRIGSVDLRTGSLERAEKIHREVLDQTRSLLGQGHSQTAYATNGLGVVLLQQGNYDEAEALFLESITAYEALQGANSAGALRPMINLALAYTETQRYDEAIPIHDELLRREIAAMGPDFWRVGLHYNNAGLVYQDLRQLKKAETSFRNAHEVIRKAWGEDHPGLAYSTNNLAIVLHDQGESEEAEALFKRALKLRRDGLDEAHPALAATLHEYGRFLIDHGRHHEAAPMVTQALAIRREKLAADDWRTQHTEALQGALLALEKDFDGAEPLITRSLAGLETSLGPTHWRTLDTRRRAYDMYRAWGREQQADNYAPSE